MDDLTSSAGAHASNLKSKYDDLMQSTVSYHGKTFTGKEVSNCYGIRKNEVSAFFYRVKVFLSKGVWLDRPSIRAAHLSDNFKQKFSNFDTDLNESAKKTDKYEKYKKISDGMKEIFDANLNLDGTDSEINEKSYSSSQYENIGGFLCTSAKTITAESTPESTTESTIESFTESSSESPTEVFVKKTIYVPNKNPIRSKSPKMKEQDVVITTQLEDSEAIEKYKKEIQEETQKILLEVKDEEEAHAQQLSEATKKVGKNLTTLAAAAATSGTGKATKLVATTVFKSEVGPVISMALENFSNFCLDNMAADNRGRRIFKKLSEDNRNDIRDLYAIKEELKAAEYEKSKYTTRALSYIIPSSQTESDERIAQLQAKEQQLLEKLGPVQKLLKEDKAAPLFPALQKEFAHTLSAHLKALADAYSQVKSAYPKFEEYPKNYQHLLIAQEMAEDNELVAVSSLSITELDVYYDFVTEKAIYLDLDRRINEGSDVNPALMEAREQSRTKCEELIPKIERLERIIGRELAMGNRDAESQFVEESVSRVIVDTILFPEGLKIGALKTKLAAKLIDQRPEEFLKKMAANQVVAMLIDTMSDPDQIHSLSGSYISSQAKAIRKLARKQEALTDADSKLHEVGLELERNQTVLESLNDQYRAYQDKLADWLNRQSDLDGQVAIRQQHIRDAFAEDIGLIQESIQQTQADIGQAQIELESLDNPGWISWGLSSISYYMSTDEQVTQVEQQKIEQRKQLEASIEKLENDIVAYHDQIQKVTDNVERRIENLQDEVAGELVDEEAKLGEEHLKIDQKKVELEQNIAKLEQEDLYLNHKREKLKARIEELSATGEPEITDQMLIDALIGPKGSTLGIKEDLKQMAVSLTQIAAPKTGMVLETIGRWTGYDEVYAEQAEQYLTAILDQFALTIDENTLEEGYEKLTSLLNDEPAKQVESKDAKLNKPKHQKQIEKDVKEIVEYQMGSMPSFATQHVASSVMASYELFDNPALNRVLACQLLGAMARAIDQVQPRGDISV